MSIPAGNLGRTVIPAYRTRDVILDNLRMIIALSRKDQIATECCITFVNMLVKENTFYLHSHIDIKYIENISRRALDQIKQKFFVIVKLNTIKI